VQERRKEGSKDADATVFWTGLSDVGDEYEGKGRKEGRKEGEGRKMKEDEGRNRYRVRKGMHHQQQTTGPRFHYLYLVHNWEHLYRRYGDTCMVPSPEGKRKK
jgi:hypothetical protein